MILASSPSALLDAVDLASSPVHAPGHQLRWTTANVDEGLPGVLTPLTWSMYFPPTESTMRDCWVDMGVMAASDRAIPDDVDARFFSAAFGRAIANVDHMAQMAARIPGGSAVALEEQLFGVVQPGGLGEPTGLARVRRWPSVALKLPGVMRGAIRRHPEISAETSSWWSKEAFEVDLSRAEAVAKLVEARAHFERVLATHMVLSMATQGLMEQIMNLADRAGDRSLAGEVVRAKSGTAEFFLISDLHAMADGELELDVFLRNHGYHGAREGLVESVSWREDPEPVHNLMRAYQSRTGAETVEALTERRAAEQQEALERLVSGLNPIQRAAAKRLVGYCANLPDWRETGRENILKCVDVARAMSREVGRYFVEAGIVDDERGIDFLTIDEIAAFEGGGIAKWKLRELIDVRRCDHRAYEQFTLPHVFHGTPEPIPAIADEEHRAAISSEIIGLGVSNGVAEGVVRVVDDLHDVDLSSMPTEVVLVCRVTDPSWASLFPLSVAVVTDTGSHLSHAAIVCRELGLPCVANTRTGTSVLRDGDLVRVDGAQGIVTLLGEAASANDPLAVSFSAASQIPDADRVALLGGKGAALARMVAMGLPVPPGFTLTTTACHRFLDHGWSQDLDDALIAELHALQAATGKKLGDVERPLLLSVRSGAPISMPGMMDTVLNAGMTAAIADALCIATNDDRFGWDTYRRFVQSYTVIVLAAPDDLVRTALAEHLGDDEGRNLSGAELSRCVLSFRDALAAHGYVIPDDAAEQIRAAVSAVFASWNGERSRVYREVEGIGDDLGTGATVQMMAFGNLGNRSGTGVAFSRDPSSGAPGVMGDFLQGAQGEDVVAGTHETQPIATLREVWPEIGEQLDHTAALLERTTADIVDIEFTVEQGDFWLLQVRRGKHTPTAALRMAIDMAEDPNFPLTRAEALDRVEATLANPPTVSVDSAVDVAPDVLASGLAASPGFAVGGLCLDVDAAVAAGGRGEDIVLLRRETSPADIAGMAAARGIVTTLGGLVSHAAVVARGWALPAVVGASGITIEDDGIRVGDRFVPVGSVVTVDGTGGALLLGAYRPEQAEVPEVAVLRSWQRDATTGAAHSGVAGAVGDTFGEEVTAANVERVLVIKGMGDTSAVAAVLGASTDEVAPVFAGLVAAGAVQELPNGRLRPTPDTVRRVDAWFVEESKRVTPILEPHMGPFGNVNDAFKKLVTDWQLRTVEGELVPNDHSDAGHDASVIERLRTEIHVAITPIVEALSSEVPRFARYGARLAAALAAIDDGDHDMIAHPFRDSYHTVWFELHEELIRLSGRNRADEERAYST